jgi:hypothetical protein
MPQSADDARAGESRSRQGQDDVIGQDRLARSVLRVVGRMPPASLVAVQGAPGSGKAEFFRRLAWLAHVGGRTGRGEGFPGLFPSVVWYDPWAWSKQGNVLAGLVAAVTRSAANPALMQDRARNIISNLAKMRLDGRPNDGQTTAFSGLEADPLEQAIEGFRELVQMAKGGRAGRLLLFVDGVDHLSPALRMQVFDGLRLMMVGQPDATAMVCVGREAAMAAVRQRDGELADESADRAIDSIFDLRMTVPGLDVRRIGILLRERLGSDEAVVRRAFGPEAINSLSTAVAHRPLGAPQLLQRLAWRVQLLAEYAHEVRANRELSEAQWAWVVVSERWPAFRRFMIRGGRDRWAGLKQVCSAFSSKKVPPGGLRPEIVARLEADLLLADYLRLHADGFERDAEGILWLENLLLAAGL